MVEESFFAFPRNRLELDLRVNRFAIANLLSRQYFQHTLR